MIKNSTSCCTEHTTALALVDMGIAAVLIQRFCSACDRLERACCARSKGPLAAPHVGKTESDWSAMATALARRLNTLIPPAAFIAAPTAATLAARAEGRSHRKAALLLCGVRIGAGVSVGVSIAAAAAAPATTIVALATACACAQSFGDGEAALSLLLLDRYNVLGHNCDAVVRRQSLQGIQPRHNRRGGAKW